MLQGDEHAGFRVRYTPDGSRILATTETTSLVNIIDPNDLQGPQSVLTVGKSPMGLGFAANGETALVANHGDGTVSVLDLEGDQKSSAISKRGPASRRSHITDTHVSRVTVSWMIAWRRRSKECRSC